ncbi:lipopolysaccharide biosynthesis protein [Kocuria rhizosphaericola]|uniref:lipopolysaccharide biosynthesis protein n=2 Tax=Kocuria rhizosphaericola TaxID=3376284 RepID=UPI0037AFFDBF
MSRLRSILFPAPNHANTDNPLGSAFALTVVAVFVQGLSRFGYSVLVGRLLGQETLGEVNLTISLALFLVLLWPQASGTAASKFIAMARGRQDPQGQAATASFTAASASAGMALLSVSAVLYAAFVLELSWGYAVSAGLLVLSLSAYNFVRGVRTGNNQFVTTTAWDTISSFLTLTLLLLVLLAGWHWALLLPLITGYAVYALPSWPRRTGARLDPVRRREILVFTTWGSAHIVAATGLMQLSLVIGDGFATKAEVGLYAAAVALATPASMLSGAMLTALSPSVARMFSSGDTAGLARQVDVILRTMVTVFLPVFGVGILWAEPVLLIFGREYQEAESLLVVLFFAVSATSFNAANARLNGTEPWGIKVLAAANGLGLVLGVATMLLLGPELGIMASAVGYLVGSLLSSVLPLLVVWRLDRMRWGTVLLRIVAGYAMVLGALQVLGPDFRVLPALGATAVFLAVWAGLSLRDLRPALRAVGARLRR